jgi:hypothetical protein
MMVVVPVHAIMHMGGGGRSPCILHVGGEWCSRPGRFTYGERTTGTNRRLGGPLTRSGRFGVEENALPMSAAQPVA